MATPKGDVRLRWGAIVLVLGLMGGVLGTEGDPLAGPPDVRPVGVFSEMRPSRGMPVGWESVTLAAAYDTTEYQLVRTDRGSVVRGYSDGGASAIGTRIRVDLEEHPVLEWHWKVDGIVESGKAGVRGRHDFPARLYVSFEYDGLGLRKRLKLTALKALGFEAVPRRAIVYTWANRVPVGSVVRSPYVEWLRQLAVRSGTTHVGTWMTERRNVRADYRAIFGEEPPPVNGVALMTNSMHTGEEVTAYYGDIRFRAKSPEEGEGTPETVRRTLKEEGSRSGSGGERE